jgi:diguanylate cyclase (GGDEF)-like protein
MGHWTESVARARAVLPRGRRLPISVWHQRHRWVMTVLWVQIAVLPVLGLAWHASVATALGAGLLPAVPGLAAASRRIGPMARGCLACIGLMAVSASLVQIAHGAIEAHFHFFIMIPVIAFYENWAPFLCGVGFVLFEHGVVGTAHPSSVYDHSGAKHHPWLWAGVHAGCFAAACTGSIVAWKLQESAFDAQLELRQALNHGSSHDPVTGLRNAVGVRAAGDRFVDSAQRAGQSFTVLMLDLDRFKDVNDAFGHRAGDELLAVVGERLTAVLREDDLVGRLGGDSFAVLLPGLDEGDALEVAQRLICVMSECILVEDLLLDIDASIGLASWVPGSTFDELLRRADVAVHLAKDAGGGTVAYDLGKDDVSRDRLLLLSEFRAALAGNQLVVHFQPKVALGSSRVVGAEALVRWEHPERGLISPNDFVPAVENTPLVIPLTEQVLDLSLQQARQWHDMGHAISVAVNVAPRALLDDRFPGVVARLLAVHGLKPAYLRLEITETSLMSDPQKALRILHEVAATGVGVSIDDFGTGYSSMSYLRDLPVDELKVDRTFVMNLAAAAGGDSVLVRSAIDLGHNLGLTVVAEGIEDEETLGILGLLGCDVAQGYHLARPMPGHAMIDWLAARLPVDHEGTARPAA